MESILDNFYEKLKSEAQQAQTRIKALEDELATTKRELEEKNKAYIQLKKGHTTLAKLYKKHLEEHSSTVAPTQNNNANKENIQLHTPEPTVTRLKRTAFAPIQQNTPTKRPRILEANKFLTKLASPENFVIKTEPETITIKTEPDTVTMKKEKDTVMVKTKPKPEEPRPLSDLYSSPHSNHYNSDSSRNTNNINISTDGHDSDATISENDEAAANFIPKKEQNFNWLERFEINPEHNNGQKHAYTEVVRNKDERKRMDGGTCECCEGYYERMHGDQSIPENRAAALKHQKKISKHRHWWATPPSPPGYWDMGFPNTQKVKQLNAESRRREQQRLTEMEEEAKRPNGRYRYRTKDLR